MGGGLAPDDLRLELAAARGLSEKPLAVNLLLPSARRAHFEAASQADVLVTFSGTPRRQTSRVWIHQCGSGQEALTARERASGLPREPVYSGGTWLLTWGPW
jgi:nitronate monooxygenase